MLNCCSLIEAMQVEPQQLTMRLEISMFDHIGLLCNCEGRHCGHCDQTKCHRAFSKDRKGKFGLSSWCKECVKSHQQANLDRINAQRRKNRQEKAEQYNAYNREFHRKNPEPKKARDRKYRLEHAEEIKAFIRNYTRTNEQFKKHKAAYGRQYRQLYPEKNAQYFNNRRARIEQVGGSFTSREWKQLCKHYNYTCLCCGRQEPNIKLTVDHVIPLAMGGANSIDNIQPLCQSCNSSKYIKAIDYRINWE